MAMTISALGAATYISTDTNTYAGTASVPTAGNLMIVAFYVTGYTGDATCTGGGFTWDLLAKVPANGGANTVFVFTAGAITATSTTPTISLSSNATGCIISGVRVAGNEGQAQAYIRQASTSSGSTTNPTCIMPTSPLTGNGMIAIAVNLTNSAVQWTAPNLWTELTETAGTVAPLCSMQLCYRLTGQTSATLTWTNANTTAWTTFAAEFYVAGTGPIVRNDNEIGDDFFGMTDPY